MTLEEELTAANEDPCSIIGLRNDESLARWRTRAVLAVLERRGIILNQKLISPLLPPAPEPIDQAGQWKPAQILRGKWQCVRETREGSTLNRVHDTAIREEDGIRARVEITFRTEMACQIRADELNRRQRIGSAVMPEIRRSDLIEDVLELPQVRGH